MGPVGHSLISAGIGGAVWGATGSPVAGAVAVGVGVLVDLDHLYDFYNWYIRRKGDKLHVLFHGWEYSIAVFFVLGLVYYHPLLLAAALAHLAHVTTDHFNNGLPPLGYSVIYRAWVRFDASKLVPGRNVTHSYRAWVHLIPLGHFIEPWFRRRIEPWILSRLEVPTGSD
jgi:hypothetical protein